MRLRHRQVLSCANSENARRQHERTRGGILDQGIAADHRGLTTVVVIAGARRNYDFNSANALAAEQEKGREELCVIRRIHLKIVR
jgi:hypothetical protein